MKSRSKSSRNVDERDSLIDLAEPPAPSSKIATSLVAEEPTTDVPVSTGAQRDLAAPSRPSEFSIGDRNAPAAYPLAIIAALLWIGGVAAYVAYQVGGGQLELDLATGALIALVALAPTGLALLIANLSRQAAALAAEVRRARGIADNLGLPTGLAVQETGQALVGLRSDIDQSTAAAETARAEIAALRAAMEEETRRLNEAADLAQRTARRITEQLSNEREGLAALGGRLESQAQGVIETVEQQARMVADASDLAQTQLREAEAALAARAADMASAAGEAQDAARAAADDLSRQTMRLETAGSGVADQIRSVEEGLSEQRAALVQAAFGLRRDQEDFSAQVESQRAQLTESLGQVRLASTDLNERSTVSVAAIQDLLEAATDQVKALSEMAQTEARAFDSSTRQALDKFEDLAAQARENAVQESERTLADLQSTLEAARSATEAAVISAQSRLDGLGEMAFAAGKAADQAAESRLVAVRRVVEETASLGEDAVTRIAGRLEESLLEVRAAIAHVEDSLRHIDERAARLPADARARVDEISAAVENSLNTLTEATRRAAAETEAVDSAFQDRVKRNYEMLSEAVQLMGVVSGDAAAGTRRPRPTTPEDANPDAPSRGRLRLTPTSKDEEVRKAFEPTNPPLAPQSEPMSWKELLASADEAPIEFEAESNTKTRQRPSPSVEVLFADLTAGIREMGIDPSALLPRARVEEAARALEAGDVNRARDIVRRVAPAAVRRISRRVLTDRQMRTDVEQFVQQYADVVEAAVRRPDGEAPGDLLGTEAGRTYLLLDAAVGDLS